jgi:hypothetical protein
MRIRWIPHPTQRSGVVLRQVPADWDLTGAVLPSPAGGWNWEIVLATSRTCRASGIAATIELGKAAAIAAIRSRILPD